MSFMASQDTPMVIHILQCTVLPLSVSYCLTSINTFLVYFPNFVDGWMSGINVFLYADFMIYIHSEHFLYILLLHICTQRSCMLKEATKTCLSGNFTFWLRASIILWDWPIAFGDVPSALTFRNLFTVPVTIVNNHRKMWKIEVIHD